MALSIAFSGEAGSVCGKKARQDKAIKNKGCNALQRRRAGLDEDLPGVKRRTVKRRLEPLLRQVLHFYWWLSRGMTLGVRAVVLDDNNRVFLVKHSYVDGWHLPGGGVEVGET